MKRILVLACVVLGMVSTIEAAEADLKDTASPVYQQSAEYLNSGEALVLPPAGSPAKAVFMAQTESDEITHTALASAMEQKDVFYYVKTGAAIPIYDKKFCDFLDYGADVTLGIGKKISSNLTITASIDVVMMTGKWSVKGDRESIEIAAEERPAGGNSEPIDFITPEDLGGSSLGVSYTGSGEVVILSSENLKSIDVDTTLYLFPITLGALYRFHEEGTINPYVGGGIGFCIAERSIDSKALKEKYFQGPEYGIKLNDSQTVRGTLFQLVAGVDIPLRKNMKLVAQADTTFYDLKRFDPILEISNQKTTETPFEGYPDITTYSYESPSKIGVFQEEFITNISIGLVMPF